MDTHVESGIGGDRDAWSRSITRARIRHRDTEGRKGFVRPRLRDRRDRGLPECLRRKTGHGKDQGGDKRLMFLHIMIFQFAMFHSGFPRPAHRLA